MVAHRRAGKTVACIADLVLDALHSQKQDARYAYIAPQFNQAKDVAWLYIKRLTADIPGVTYNEAELRANLPNGAQIRLYGADNPDRLRGLYLDGVILDEPADMKPRMWAEVIRPALSDRKGWAAFIGTPKGHNDFYRIWTEALEDKDWFTLMLRASETGLLDAEELASARKTMSEDQYEQEYECSFEAAIVGAIYGKEMKAAADRIRNVPYDPALMVSTAWDLGVGDANSIWFAQCVGSEVRIIDFYENSQMGLDHYAKVLREKPYVYAEHLLPHDIEVKELGTGRTRLETLQSLGVSNTRVLPLRGVEDGIQAARTLIPRCYFDQDKCKQGIEALKQYQYEWDDDRKTLTRKPRHDWTSHAADAFRYLAMGLRAIDKKVQKINYSNRGIV